MPERTERTSGTEYEVPPGGPTLVLLEATMNAEVDSVVLEVWSARFTGSLAGMSCARFDGVMVTAGVISFALPAGGTWRPMLRSTGRAGSEVRLYSRYV